jgi:O-acetylserine/cysteine efflux transporter
MKPRDLFFLMIINFAWGFNIAPTKWTLNEVPPMTAAVVRFALVGLLCAPWLQPLKEQWKLILAFAFMTGVVMFGLNNTAYHAAHNVSALAIAGQLGVPFSLLLGIVFLKERIKLPRAFGIALSFAGVAWFSFDPAAPAAFADIIPLLLSVGGSLAYAVGTLFQRKIKNMNALSMQAWLAIISVPPLLILSLMLEPGALAALPQASARAWGSMFFSVVCASIIGHAGISYLLQRYPISVISPLTLLAPIIGVISGVAILNTPLTLKMIQGGIVTLIGVAIITVRTAQRSPAPPSPNHSSAP